jgi:hypothetical protein
MKSIDQVDYEQIGGFIFQDHISMFVWHCGDRARLNDENIFCCDECDHELLWGSDE